MNKNKLVIIKVKGGMGNQMFQYAFGRALEASAQSVGQPLQMQFDVTAYTDPNKKDTLRPYFLEQLNTTAQKASDAAVATARNPLGVLSKAIRQLEHKLHLGNTAAFKPNLLQPPYKKYYEGYWQSEKYFLPLAETIRQEYTLKEPFGAVAQSMYDTITKDAAAVSIFYRRTDYVGHSVFDIGEQEYQLSAIKKMQELVPEMRLYVMSDDITWVKQNTKLPANSVYVSASEIPPQEELFLAAACKHHIIPNSTFAWWGAWLGKNPDKIVIAPKKWVRGDDTEYKDIVPESWLRV